MIIRCATTYTTLRPRSRGAGAPAIRPPPAQRCAPAPPRAETPSAPPPAPAPAPAPAPTTGAAAGQALSSKRCEPCEASADAEAAMGLRAAFDRSDAERYLAHLQPGWRLAEDEQARLRVRRRLRTKNFVKARPEGR
ncbi:hypothetical protein MNEG_14946, partial [Monoraphidium neglectum]